MSAEHTFAENTQKTFQITTEDDKNRTMKPSSLFFIWFAANLTIGDFAIGFIPISLGMPVDYAVVALIIGNITGGMLLGMMSMTGALTGKPQMALSLGPFGQLGSRVLAVLQWGNTLGWLTVNLVLASFALHVIVPGVSFLIPVFIVTAIVFALAYAGHNWIRRFEVAMSVVLGVMFAVISIRYFTTFSSTYSYHPSGLSPLIAFGITLAASFSYIMAWGPYASDYSRFTRKADRPRRSFGFTFAGGAIASFWIEIIGMAVAISAHAYISNPATALARYMGAYAAVGMISLFLGGIAANAINLFSNATSLNTAITRLTRNRALVIGVIVSLALGIIGYRNFYGFYETFLFILDYWITPWLGILIAHYFITGRNRSTGLVSYSGISAYVLAILISVPFMSPGAVFEGPLAYYLGSVDISYYISFFASMILYITFNNYFRVNHARGAKPLG